MRRLISAYANSRRAWSYLVRNEAAMRLELVLLALAIPVSWFLAGDWRTWLLLVGSIVLVIIVETLNTGIEAACNAISREFSPDIRLAKDCGSLAVLVASLFAAGTWLVILFEALVSHAS